jgi:hypothetical protein
MFRTIITPKQTTLTIELPDQMVGKSVEVIAFEIEDNGEKIEGPKDSATGKRKRTFEEAVKFWDENAVDFSKFEKWKREDLYE